MIGMQFVTFKVHAQFSNGLDSDSGWLVAPDPLCQTPNAPQKTRAHWIRTTIQANWDAKMHKHTNIWFVFVLCAGQVYVFARFVQRSDVHTGIAVPVYPLAR